MTLGILASCFSKMRKSSKNSKETGFYIYKLAMVAGKPQAQYKLLSLFLSLGVSCMTLLAPESCQIYHSCVCGHLAASMILVWGWLVWCYFGWDHCTHNTWHNASNRLIWVCSNGEMAVLRSGSTWDLLRYMLRTVRGHFCCTELTDASSEVSPCQKWKRP